MFEIFDCWFLQFNFVYKVNMAMSNPVNNHMSGMSTPSPTGEILNNLRHVFLSTFDPKNLVFNEHILRLNYISSYTIK